VGSYALNYGGFEIPGVDLADATTHVVHVRSDEHEGVMLVVYRSRIALGRSLRDVVAARIAEEMTRLSGYVVLENADVEWGGKHAVDVAARYRHEGRVMYVRQGHVQHTDCCITFAMSGKLASRAAIDAWLEAAMTSFRIRNDVEFDV
jgi:hypothetical protein